MVIEAIGSQMSLPAKGGVGTPPPVSTIPKNVQKAPPVSPAPKKAEAEAEAEPESRQTPVTSANITKLVESINDRPQVQKRSLQFSVHESTGKMQVRVYNAETNELIRQFPSDELLRIAEHIDEILAENLSGIILRDQA